LLISSQDVVHSFLWLCCACTCLLLQRLEARLVLRLRAAPLKVGCPDCGENFALSAGNASVPAGGDLDEAWLRENCRACPRCKAQIQKNGGCNHMRCTKCHAHFCWACMRVGNRCGAYNCHNGAPFQNAPLLVVRRSALRSAAFVGVLWCSVGLAFLDLFHMLELTLLWAFRIMCVLLIGPAIGFVAFAVNTVTQRCRSLHGARRVH